MTKLLKEKVNIWDLWTKNWENAKRFFESKGNIKTKSAIKTKWYKDFEQDIIQILQLLSEETKWQVEQNQKRCFNWCQEEIAKEKEKLEFALIKKHSFLAGNLLRKEREKIEKEKKYVKRMRKKLKIFAEENPQVRKQVLKK